MRRIVCVFSLQKIVSEVRLGDFLQRPNANNSYSKIGGIGARVHSGSRVPGHARVVGGDETHAHRAAAQRRQGPSRPIEGDAFLLQASVLVCSAASLGWTTPIVLYGVASPR